MVHILLMILKILGIILLVLLGIVLALVLLVLLVPVRYRLKAGYDQKPAGDLRVTWLLRIISYRAEYTEKGLIQALRIFGLRIWHSEADSREVEDGVESVLSQEERDLYEELRREDRERQEETKPQSGGNRQEGMASQNDSGRQGETDAGEAGLDNDHEQDPYENLIPEDEDFLLGAQSLPEEPVFTEDTHPPAASPDAPPVRKKGIISRIGAQVRAFIEKLRFSFQAICGKLRDIRKLIQDGRAWLEDEKNQASIRLLVRQAKRLLRHIFPLKGHASVTFGFDDPYTTGQVLSAVSPFSPLYHKILEIHPVFDESVLRARGDIRGRIRLLTLLWLAFQVYRDKHTWKLICSFRR